jgi:hypothetical protein
LYYAYLTIQNLSRWDEIASKVQQILAHPDTIGGLDVKARMKLYMDIRTLCYKPSGTLVHTEYVMHLRVKKSMNEYLERPSRIMERLIHEADHLALLIYYVEERRRLELISSHIGRLFWPATQFSSPDKPPPDFTFEGLHFQRWGEILDRFRTGLVNAIKEFAAMPKTTADQAWLLSAADAIGKS